MIAPNAFYFGLGAQVMTSVISSLDAALGGHPSVASPPVSRFPGGYLNEQLSVLGFLGSQVIPTMLTGAFVGNNSALIEELRGAGTVFYAAYMQAAVGAMIAAPLAFTYMDVMASWANKSVAVPTIGSLSSADPAHFFGFELPTPLLTTNSALVAANLWNASNPYSFASASGLQNQWAVLSANTAACAAAGSVPSSASCVAAVTKGSEMAAGLGMLLGPAGDPYQFVVDLASIGAWLSTITTSALPGTTLGNAFQKTVCDAIAAQVANLKALYGGATPFAAYYVPTLADYQPTTWAEVAALQFGTGIIVAMLSSSSDASVGPALLGHGRGLSLSYMDRTASLNFASLEPEPFEFTAGIRYYLDHRLAVSDAVAATWPAGADQKPLWTANPALLWADYASDVLINLNVAQSVALFDLLLNPAYKSQMYGGMVGVLEQIVGAYAGAFATAYRAAYVANFTVTHDDTLASLFATPAANTAAIAAADAAYTAASAVAPLVYPNVRVVITRTNWYAVWSYLYNYLGHEMSGSLAQLDSMGIAPQNSGLFMRLSVQEMLFGQTTARFGASAVAPPIAGVQMGSKPLAQILAADSAAHLGRLYVTDTGHANIDTVGEWVEYEGVAKYQYNCELVDPRRRGECSTPAGAFANNFKIWGANETIAGSGSSAQIGPFKEGDAQRPAQLQFYVSELKKVVVAEYKSDVDIKGISLRRYGLYEALIDAAYVTPNPLKDEAVWWQGTGPDVVPRGLFNLASANGGLPVHVSLPYFGLSNAGAINANMTCDGLAFSANYQPAAHDTYLDMEPLSGITMNGAKRLQAAFKATAQEYYTGAHPAYPAAYPANYSVDPRVLASPATGANFLAPAGLTYMWNHLFAASSGRETMYLPYYWADLHDVIGDDDAAKFRKAMNTIKMARAAAAGMRVAGVIVGALTALASLGALALILRGGGVPTKPF